MAPPGPSQPAGPVNALANLQKLANTSLVLSIVSVFCCGPLAIVALVLATKAQREARTFGTTSVDGKINAARIVSIIAIVIWIAFAVLALASSSSDTT
jgi:hypothetical protein